MSLYCDTMLICQDIDKVLPVNVMRLQATLLNSVFTKSVLLVAVPLIKV